MLHHEWNWMVVVYLYVGGLGAGCLVLSGLAHLSRWEHLRGIARAGALFAPVLVILGCGLLVFDLGKPLNFWRLFTSWNPVSPMWVGSWLLMFFSLISLCQALLHLPPRWALALGRSVPSLRRPMAGLSDWNSQISEQSYAQTTHGDEPMNTYPNGPRAINKLRDLLATIGIPVGIGVGIYTGVLLGAVPARPFWNTPMVAQLFLFSALSTATALLFLVVPRVWEGSQEHRKRERKALVTADLFFMVGEFFIIVPFVIHAQLGTLSEKTALDMILGGAYTNIFWIGVVLLGLFLPMIIEVGEYFDWFKRLPQKLVRPTTALAAILILFGGYLLRWIFVHAGQDTTFL